VRGVPGSRGRLFAFPGDGRRGLQGNLETGALGGPIQGVSGFPCGLDC
jgi:hypothetical protein